MNSAIFIASFLIIDNYGISICPIGGGMFPSKNMNPIYKGIPYINMPFNIANNPMYTLEFQTQHHYLINLSPMANLSEI